MQPALVLSQPRSRVHSCAAANTALMDNLRSDRSMSEITMFSHTTFWLSSKGALFPHSKTKLQLTKQCSYHEAGQTFS